MSGKVKVIKETGKLIRDGIAAWGISEILDDILNGPDETQQQAPPDPASEPAPEQEPAPYEAPPTHDWGYVEPVAEPELVTYTAWNEDASPSLPAYPEPVSIDFDPPSYDSPSYEANNSETISFGTSNDVSSSSGGGWSDGSSGSDWGD